jgi:acetyl-CoA carboxylase / biotin carboxylase 1
MTHRELILNQASQLEHATRPPGLNDCGMVAWEMEFFTPEFPEGRSVVVIGFKLLN